MSRILPSVLLLLLVGAGCTAQDPAADSAPAATIESPVPAAPAAPAAPADPASVSTPQTSSAAPVATATVLLNLDGEGLQMVDGRSGASRSLTFGTAQSPVIEMVTRIVGSSPVEQGDNNECRARFVRWSNGLSAWFTDGKFTGWSVRESTLATASGLGLGSTRADLDSAYAAQVMDSSLGIEFSAGGLAGLLESRAPSAKVTNLWAGDTCIAR